MSADFLNQMSASDVGGVSVRPQGDIPVIARLVTAHGERWVPMRAIRWTSTAVMVVWVETGPDGRRRDGLAWLPAGDVARQLIAPTPRAWTAARPA